MKSLGEISGEQAARFLLNDYDLQVAFPICPCLLSGLLLLPYRDRDIVILGSEKPRVIKASRNRDEVLRLLKLLDGTKTGEDLSTLIPETARESFYNLQALLFRYGLLQDGPVSSPPEGKEPLASFVGRYIDKTRFHRNGDGALDALAHSRLAVYASSTIASELSFALESAGLGAYLLVTAESDKLAEFAPTFVLVAFDGSKAANEVLKFANERSISTLWSSIGVEEARIGPYILPQITVGHECVARQLPPIRLTENRNDLLFWTAFALQETLLLMAGLTPGTYYNKSIIHHYGTRRQFTAYHNLARIPGLKSSGLPGARPLDLRSSGFLAWKQHCVSRLPAKRFLAPKTHQTHYSAQNISGVQRPLSPEYGSAIHALPPTWNLPPPLPWLDDTNVTPAKFDLASIGDLLRVAVGNQQAGDAHRRISPSGGGLKSTNFFVRTLSVTGLDDGWYGYNAGEHALETIQNLDPDGIAAALPPMMETQPLIVVAVSRLQRVRDKYHEFSYNIIHLDAGVTTAYAALVARSLGWKISYHPNVPNSSLALSLGIDEKENCKIVSNVFSLGQRGQACASVSLDEEDLMDHLIWASRVIDPRSFGTNSNSAPAMSWRELGQRSKFRSFEEAVKSRRASRDFKDVAVKAALIEDLVRLGYEAQRRSVDEGMLPVPFDLYVLRVHGDAELPSGTYVASAGEISTWKRIFSPFTADDLGQCLNQNSLGTAAVLIVVVANLDETFQRYGAAGYRHLLNQAGFVVSQIWIAAHAAGLVGTMCGGVLDEGLHRFARTDGYTQASIFGFAVGELKDKTEENRPNDPSVRHTRSH